MQFLDDIFVQFGIVFGYNANVVVNVVDARAISDYRGDDLLKISVTIFTRKKSKRLYRYWTFGAATVVMSRDLGSSSIW